MSDDGKALVVTQRAVITAIVSGKVRHTKVSY